MVSKCSIMFALFKFVVLLNLIHFSISESDEDAIIEVENENDEESESESMSATVSDVPTVEPTSKLSHSIQKYRMRFAQYRSMQAQVMQAVFKKVDKNQLGSVISMMLTNLFQIMIEARANLTQVGYVAGEEFPEFSDAKESLSKVFENTFMFGDLLLRRPTPIHVEYDQHTDWKDILTWAYYICSKSGVFLPEEQQFLDLIAKESGILPKDANFQNPYLYDSEKPRKRFEDPKPAEKKKPKKIKRGPRIIHSEF